MNNNNIIFIKSLNSDLKDKTNSYIFNNFNKLKNQNRILDYNDFKKKYPKFNLEYYKTFNKDLNNISNFSLLAHYNNIGKNEHRICNLETFLGKNNLLNYNIFIKKYKHFINLYNYNNNFYIDKNINNLKIYLIICKKKNIKTSGYIFNFEITHFSKILNIICKKYMNFNYYKNKYSDFKNYQNLQLSTHFINHGFYEDRICSVKYERDFCFDYEYYIDKYKDLKHLNSLENSFNHYINYGIKEKRSTKYYNFININKNINKSSKLNIKNENGKLNIKNENGKLNIKNENGKLNIKNKNSKLNIKNENGKLNLKKSGCSIYVSKSLKHLENRVKKIYNLKDYCDKNRKTIFFGLYSKKDFDTIKNHKGFKYIIFGGSDFDDKLENLDYKINYLLSLKNYKVFAISDNMYNRIKKYNIDCELINFNLVNKNLFKIQSELGKKIYIYDGIRKKPDNSIIYNKKIIDEVKKRLPYYEYIHSSDLNCSYEKMPEIYKECFIGLRLTKGDGNANTVQEFEAMNIPIIHNYSNYGIKWNNIDDIVKYIIKSDNYCLDWYKKNNITTNDLKKIKLNIDLFYNSIKDFKNILFICGDYPGYGGAATNCYNIQKNLKIKNFNTFGVYFNYDNSENKKYYSNNDYIVIDTKNIIDVLYNKLPLKPDLVILKSPIGNIDLKKILKCPVYYFVAGIFNNNLDKYYYELNTKNEVNKYINQNVLNQIKLADESFCNSIHTKNLLNKFYNLECKILYTTFIPYYHDFNSFSHKNCTSTKKYKYGLIVSNFNGRMIKNVKESIEFLKDKKDVILIGKNSSQYKKYGFKCLELIDNEKMNDYYKEIKYIIQDSYYESCSNVKIEALFSGCKINPLIVVSSTQYPGYGGSATNAYEIIKYLRRFKFKVCGIFFFNNLNVDYNPDKLEGIYFYKKNYNKKKVLEDVVKYLGAKPNLCMGKNYVAPLYCKKIFNCYTIYLVSGISYFLKNKSITAQDVLKENYIINKEYINIQEVNCNKNADLIICNSKLTLKLFGKIYSNFTHKLNKNFINTTSDVINNNDTNISFDENEKIYDILICCSKLDRIQKNMELPLKLFKEEEMDKFRKIIIGMNYEPFINIKNSKCTGLIQHKKTIDYLKKSKIILIPSYFDSNPNIMKEALKYKCIPIITKNIGEYENFPCELICNSFEINEWKNKCIDILGKYNKYKNISLNFNNKLLLTDII